MFEQTFKNIDDVLWKEAGCATELDYTEQTSWILFLKYLDDLEQANEQKAELEGKKYQSIIDQKHRWSVWAAPKKKDGSFDHDKAKTGDDLIDYVNRDLFPYLQGFRARAEGPNTIEYKIGEIFSEIKNRFQSGYSLRDALELMDGLSFRSQDQKHELSHIYEAKLKNMGNAGRNGGEYYTPRPLIRAMIQVVKPKIGERIYDGACGSAGSRLRAPRNDRGFEPWTFPMPHPATIRPSPYQPPSRERIERARSMYEQGFTVSRILAACDMALGTLYYWLDGGPREEGAPLYPALARRKQVVGKRRKPLETSRVSLAARLWRTAERQARDIEERLARPAASAVERERDVRMLNVLVRTLRDLALFDAGGAPGEAVEDDPVPQDMEEFRKQLARRIRGLVEEEQRRQAAEQDDQRGSIGTS